MIELQLHAFFTNNFRFLLSCKFNRPDAMFLSDTSINIFFRIGDTSINIFFRIGDTSINIFFRIGNTSINIFFRIGDTSINIFFRIGDRKAGRGGGAGEDVNGDNRK